MRRTAKSKTVLTASLAALVGVGSIGCKSMPSLPWWKTAKKDNAATAVAQAPAFPSDVALKTEGLAINSATAPKPTTTAAPFTSAAPAYTAPSYTAATAAAAPATGYPNTGVPAGYPTTTAAAPSYSNVQAAATSTAPSYASAPLANNGSNLGSIAMPYNPNAVPPAATPAAAPVAPAQAADRYASAAAPSFGTVSNVAATPASVPLTNSRYGAPSTPAISATAASPAPSYAPGSTQTVAVPQINAGATLTSAVGDRYSQTVSIPATMATAPVATTPAAAPAKAPVVASSQPYRPGGTTSYPGAKPEENKYEVAARPEATSTSTKNPVPNVATPGTPTTTAPAAPRYW